MSDKVESLDKLIGDILIEYPQIIEPLKRAFIAFAKLHVIAALKAASEKAMMVDTKDIGTEHDNEKQWYPSTTSGVYDDPVSISTKSILEAYPLDLIK
jgi:hypothetical protein